MTGPSRGRARHRSVERASSSRRPLRSLWAATAVVAGAVTVALVATGGTYALWNSSVKPTAVTVGSGTAGLSVGAVKALDTSALGPGGSTAGTFTATNTGSVDLAMRVSAGTTTASASALPGELTVRLAAVARAADCVVGVGGYSARPAAFDTGSGYFTLPAGVTVTGCVVVTLDSDVPATLQNQTSSIGLVLTGTQVAP
ncbi:MULTISPECIES: TasA family protein [unclassified Frigoribacterium]|uniref:TasA family protein n=1 Tax=unclassified Frigoribacterium TaxID=2627005 RepID=UPI0012F15935|nr:MULTISPECIES: TasA family protein [unclassified Frigoribacterium]VXB24835.1 conserved hypothetical protein [Frigoribacterium sp. 9N]